MSVLDTELGNNVIYRMLENGDADADITLPAPLLTSMFSKQAILDAVDRVQQHFLLDTGMIVTRTTIPGLANVSKYDTPINSIRPRRVAWTMPNPNAGWDLQPWDSGPWNGAANVTAALEQVDTWELDNGAEQWPSQQSTPIAWYENQLAQQRIAISPAPSTNGTVGLLYIALAAVVTGAGVPLAVPDDWTPYILWGVLDELLGSDGAAYDPVRAQYCGRRYSEGVELARIVLGGN